MHNYSQLFYHFIWSTKNREFLITQEVEDILLHYIPIKIEKMSGIYYRAGMAKNHIHLIATVPPSISLSSFVQEIKGGSAHLINKSILNGYFNWQGGYGVISFNKKLLPSIKNYVANQKQHHQNDNLINVLEKTSDESG